MPLRDSRFPLCSFLVCLLCGGAGAWATEDMAFFEREVRPLLITHCYECHSADEERKGGLLLDTREGWMIGGDSGPAIIPGDPGESLLIRSIRYEDPHLEMPPKTRLPGEVVEVLTRWVAMGAPDPRDGKVLRESSGMTLEEGRAFWSYRPPEDFAPPAVKNSAWPAGEIDHFLLAKMEAAGLDPAPQATPEALLRRLHLDLSGLPPTPEEILTFRKDPSEAAWQREVDRLLASPQFGERWARHWLDVARYGESYTLRGLIMREAWRYRDYVIEVFNRDLPYDQFVREQIAGDLMETDGVPLEVRQRRLIATGFLAFGNHNLEEQDKRQLDLDIVDEQLDTIGKAFMGLALGCARCHDHKFDPIPARDYHAMAGILASTVSLSHSNVSKWLDLPLQIDPEEEKALRSHESRLAALAVELRAAEKERVAAVAADPSRPSEPRDDGLAQRGREANAEVARIKKELTAMRESGPVRPKYLGVRESDNPADLPVLARGIVHQPTGVPVPRGFLQVTSPVEDTPSSSASIPEGQSGRLELAHWLSSPEHPLTARVFVNRVWHWMFGRGFVRTTDNFGTTGEFPSHPELLDRLTLRFVNEGWSLKWLVREIALTKAYRLSAPPDDSPWFTADPENRLFARADRRRLDAEVLRDSILQASGSLDPTAGGPTIRPAASNDYHYAQDSERRSIYLPVLRNSLPEILEAFNTADPSRTTGNRDLGTVAPQALFLMNHRFLLDQAESAARRILDEGGTEEAALERATLRVLGRKPLPAEQALVSSLLTATPEAEKFEAWSTILQGLFASLDFRYLD